MRFGAFEMDRTSGELRKFGLRIKLQEQPLRVLILMLDHAGEVIAREQLREHLWPGGTYVDFEHSLNAAIAKLRQALSDSAENPRFIETIARRGYRFIAPLERLDVTPPANARPIAAEQALLVPNPSVARRTAQSGERTGSDVAQNEMASPHHEPSPPPAPGRWRSKKRFYVAAVAVLTIAIAFSVRIATKAPGLSSPASLSGRAAAVPLTTYPGFQDGPTLSPDGSQVAFSWNGPGEDNYDIYVKLVGPGDPVRLTRDPAAELSPAWSPDGGRIAFLRYSGEPADFLHSRAELIVIPALGGGVERKIADVVRVGPVSGRLAWTSDGEWIALGGKFSENDLPGIWLLSVGTGERRRLTTGHGDIGDVAPTFSPDGLSLAFIRSRSMSTREVNILRLTAKMAPAGEPRQITTVNRQIVGVAWAPDGRSLVYSVGGPFSHLERLPVDARGSSPAPTPQVMPFGEQATSLSVSRTNGRLVYARQFRDSNIWKISLPSSRAAASYAAATPVHLIASTFLNHTPDYSPDGTKIAFASTRSGVEEIWMAHADGSAPVQLTFLGGSKAANPQWSPDGHDILFNASKEGSSDLYLITPATGSVRRLTQDPADEIEARWSRDGRWIYFGSNRTGRYEVYKMPASVGMAVQVTKDGGRVAQESQNGAWLYYSKSSIGSVWRIPRSGGKEEPVLNNLSYMSNFVVVEKGIYFVAGKVEQSGISIDFFDFATGKTKSLMRIQKPWSYGMAISPDQQSLLFSVVDTAGSNLMFVENFR